MDRLKVYLCLVTLSLMLAAFALAQQHDSPPPSPHDHHAPAAAGQWDGSSEGVAYSEFNHHLAGVFVLLIGLGELRGGLGVTM
ncbi:MAG: hypothetical protein HY059_15230, partial [Proteobacteria bacterium]|nr:hypothetical protein [Pseudomonadota bacterium]